MIPHKEKTILKELKQKQSHEISDLFCHWITFFDRQQRPATK